MSTGGEDGVFPLMQPFQLDAPDPGLAPAEQKTLGSGQYSATQTANTVTLYASGNLPSLASRAAIEALPYLIYPPRFALFFYEQALAAPHLRPFAVSVSIHAARPISQLTIVDVTGTKTVAVKQI